MAKRSEIVVLSRGERLRDSERQATSMALPLAVHHRLELLARAAQDVGATRAELVAMLIAQSSLDVDEVERAVLRYRKLKVGDVIPEEKPEASEDEASTEDNVISIARGRPGRPAKRNPA